MLKMVTRFRSFPPSQEDAKKYNFGFRNAECGVESQKDKRRWTIDEKANNLTTQVFVQF